MTRRCVWRCVHVRRLDFSRITFRITRPGVNVTERSEPTGLFRFAFIRLLVYRRRIPKFNNNLGQVVPNGYLINQSTEKSWELGAEVFDTTLDAATKLPSCSHDIMYLLTSKLAVSRFATARVGSSNRPDFAGHKNRGGARRSHFCGSAQALRSDIDRNSVPRNCTRWPTPRAAWPMKKRDSPGARRAIILTQVRSASAGWKLFGPGGPGTLPSQGSHRPVRAGITAYGSSHHGFAACLRVERTVRTGASG